MPWLGPVPTQVADDETAAPPGRTQAARPPPQAKQQANHQANHQAKPQAQPASKIATPSVTTVTKRDHLM